MDTKRVLFVAGGVVAVAGLVLATVAVVQARRGEKTEDPPILYDVPPFTFTDSNGRPFGRDNLKGKVWVADFIFTTCTGPCPILTGQMSSLYQQNKGNNRRVRFVSVTVDPAHDTPPVLAAYAANLGADTGQWHFLTGPEPAVKTLMQDGLKLGSGGNPLVHDTHFVLVDGLGRVRGYYDGTDPAEVERLNHDLKRLLGRKS